MADDAIYPADVRHHLASTLIEASNLSSAPWKQDVVNSIRKLLDVDSENYLDMRYAHGASSLFRMLGKEKELNAVLETIVHKTLSPIDDGDVDSSIRRNASRGELIVSYAQNLVSHFDVINAKHELYTCRREALNSTNPTLRKRVTLYQHNAITGSIFRYGGKAEGALQKSEEQLLQSEMIVIRVADGDMSS